MDVLGKNAHELQSLLKPIVDLIVKEIHPVNDEISLNQAHHAYPRRWVEDQIKRGNIAKVHRGNKWMLSRAELACLWAADHEAPSIITTIRGGM